MFCMSVSGQVCLCIYYIQNNSDPFLHIQFLALFLPFVFWICVNGMSYLNQCQLFWEHDTGQMSVLLQLVEFSSHSAFAPELPPKVTLRGRRSHLFHIPLCSDCSVVFQLSVRWIRPMTFEVAATHSDEDRGRWWAR